MTWACQVCGDVAPPGEHVCEDCERYESPGQDVRVSTDVRAVDSECRTNGSAPASRQRNEGLTTPDTSHWY